MEPETEHDRLAREADLKRRCEAMGLVAVGSIVVAPMAAPVAVDASAVDHDNIAACLIYLAHKAGIEAGREMMRADLARLLAPREA